MMNKIWIIGILAILLICGCTDSEPIEQTKYQCADNTFVDNQEDCLKVEPIIKKVEVIKEIEVPTEVIKEIEIIKEIEVIRVEPTEVTNYKTIIKEDCEKEWGSDFSMRAYCEKKQLDAYNKLKDIQPSDIPNTVFTTIYEDCEDDWHKDYSMQVYCIEKQIDAWRKIQ